jgi:dTDP-4-dehydrorhamnose 3,5-epimerase
MQFTELGVQGVYLVEDDVFEDERGSFSRVWMPDEFRSRGLETAIAQTSLARNHARGTLRGMHFQAAPHEEVKLVRVIRGAIFDVAVDLRPDSPTYLRWAGAELTSDTPRWIYLPRGVAHGYQTLEDRTEVFYFVSTPYVPAFQRGVRWNDPAFGIQWPVGQPAVINERDAKFPDYAPSTVAASWPTLPTRG